MTKDELDLLESLFSKAETQARKLLEIRHSMEPVVDYPDLYEFYIEDQEAVFAGSDRAGDSVSFKFDKKWLADEEGFIEKTKKDLEAARLREEARSQKYRLMQEEKERKEFLRLQEKFGK